MAIPPEQKAANDIKAGLSNRLVLLIAITPHTTVDLMQHLVMPRLLNLSEL